MATLNARLEALEKSTDNEPMMTMQVNEMPTDEQAALIERCTRTGRRLVVFYDPGNTAWMPDAGTAPWERNHGNA